MKNIISDEALVALYKHVGARVGHGISYIGPMGAPIGFPQMMQTLAEIEREHARRGFRTVNMNTLVAYGGYNRQDLEYMFKIKRPEGEEPILHARNSILANAKALEHIIQDGEVIPLFLF